VTLESEELKDGKPKVLRQDCACSEAAMSLNRDPNTRNPASEDTLPEGRKAVPSRERIPFVLP